MNEIQSIETLTAEILILKQQTAQNIIEIGKRLIAVKDSLPHGEWGKWLEEKVDFHQNTALKYMRVANEFSNSTSLLNLGTAKLFALLDVPSEEREVFVEENKVDEMTTRELQKVIAEKKALEKQFEDAVKQLSEKPKEITREVEKTVIPDDYYSTKGEVNKLKQQLSQKSNELNQMVKDKELLERKVKLNEEDAKKFNELKSQIDFLNKQKSDLARQIESATELAAVAVRIDNILKTELAPIRYSRTFERMDSEVARNNLLDILDSVQSWCNEIREMIPREYRRVEVI